MRVVGKLWRGEYALPVAFWGFYFGGLLACGLVSLLILMAARFVFYTTLVTDPTATGLAVCYWLSCAYLLVASVAVWRSAEPYWTSPIGTRRFWAGAARVVVVIWIANVARGMIEGGAPP